VETSFPSHARCGVRLALVGLEMPKRILIVDDEPYIGYLVKMVLARRGYEVVLALDAEEALQANEEQGFDLYLLDIMMPNMNGFDLCAKLRENDECGEVPFIMLTARGDERTKHEAWEAGAAEFVTKPFSPKALLLRVEEIMGDPAAEEG
jgi:DNA-binding response OmpR family regulator